MLPLLFLTSCLNQYEKEIVGSYIVSEYTLKDSTLTSSMPTLELTKEGTFTITQKDKVITGKWDAGDNGDWTWIEFSVNETTYPHQGRLYGRPRLDQVMILNPHHWIEPNFKELEFKRYK